MGGSHPELIEARVRQDVAPRIEHVGGSHPELIEVPSQSQKSNFLRGGRGTNQNIGILNIHYSV